MDMAYVTAVMAGRGAEVGAPAPLLRAKERDRAVERLLASAGARSTLTDIATVLDLHVHQHPLPAAVPFCLVGRVVLCASPVTDVQIAGALAFVALRSLGKTFSSSDTWLAAAAQMAVYERSPP